MKKIICFLFIVFIIVVNNFTLYAEEENEGGEKPLVKGEILDELDPKDYPEIIINEGSKLYQVMVKQGEFSGEILAAEYDITYFISMNYERPELDVGTEVMLSIQKNELDKISRVFITDVARDKYLLYLCIFFIVALLIVGRSKGLRAVISLIITCIVILKVVLPLIVDGHDPVLVSVPICMGIIIMTVFMVCGINRKSIAAIVGTSGGVIISGIIVKIVSALARIQGIGSEESRLLMSIPLGNKLDLGGVLFAGVIIGALGAAIDVGISIASSMNEIKLVKPDIKRAELIKRGMNVGKDIMATMSNTLILAYLGGSMQLLIIFAVFKAPFANIINQDLIASEVVRAVAGSIGLIFTIPFTAIVAGLIYFNYFNVSHKLEDNLNKYKYFSKDSLKKLDYRIFLLHMILHHENAIDNEIDFVEKECLDLMNIKGIKSGELLAINELLVAVYSINKNDTEKMLYLNKVEELKQLQKKT